MSQSVWYEEVDRGLKVLVNKILGKDIKVYFVSSRENLIDKDKNPYSKLKYPYVRIVHLGETFDNKRYDINSAPIVLEKDITNSELVVESEAKPYTLNYQIELIANKISDSNDLTRLWNFSVLDKYNLDVLDKSGNERNCFMSKTIATQIEEATKNDDIIIRNIFKYKIRVELDENVVSRIPMISRVNLQFDK